MNVAKVADRIDQFVSQNSGLLREIPTIQSQVLELAVAVAAAEHYETFKYEVEFVNPKRGQEFVVKSTSRGQPWKYSRILVRRGASEFEIHMNLSVRSARDSGIYCLDLAVTPMGAVPVQRDPNWKCLPNASLITFGEAKKLVVYPMLLAHFIGIVHELAPVFLSGLPPDFEAGNHFAPALITLGYCTPNSAEIVRAYPKRNISVNVEANFDDRFGDGQTGFRFGQGDPAVPGPGVARAQNA